MNVQACPLFTGVHGTPLAQVDRDATARAKRLNPKSGPILSVKPEANDVQAGSPAYWQLHSPNTFLTYSWLYDELIREYNEQFFYLTPQNMKVRNDVLIGSVMARLGQHEVRTFYHPLISW